MATQCSPSHQDQSRCCWNGKTTPAPTVQTCRQSCWSREALVRAGLWCVPGSGACRGLCRQPAGRAALPSALPAPSPGAPEGIDFPSSLFGLLINRSCSGLGATWQVKEIYGHRPASLVSPRAPGSAPPPAELRVPPSLRHPGTGSFCSKLPKRSVQILVPS